MTDTQAKLDSIALVTIGELPGFLEFLCDQFECEHLWHYTDFDDNVAYLSQCIDIEEQWSALLDEKTPKENKPLAAGLVLPIPYVDDFFLLYGLLGETLVEHRAIIEADGVDLESEEQKNLYKKSKLWLLPAAAKLEDQKARHIVQNPHGAPFSVDTAFLLSNEAVSVKNLMDFEIKDEALVSSFGESNPEYCYLRNIMVRRLGDMGHVALLPSILDLFGYTLGQMLDAQYELHKSRMPTAEILKACGEDLTSISQYFVEPENSIAETWTQGRTRLSKNFQGTPKASKNVVEALATIANVTTPFDTWDALTLTDFCFLKSVPEAVRKEKLQTVICALDVVDLAPRDTQKNKIKKVEVKSLQAEKQWVVLNEQESIIRNPTHDKPDTTRPELRLRNPQTYQPEIIHEDREVAFEKLSALTEIQGTDEVKLKLEQCLCPTMKNWLEALS